MLGLEMIGLAVLVLGLFWMRRRFGLTPLYVSLGVFQPVQVMLSASVYVELWPGMSVSPGTLMFAASLLAILLVYIREDATEARKVIYGILGANLVMTLIMFVASVQLRTPGTFNFLAIAPELFSQGARVTAVGTLMFIADVLLLVLLYTGMRRYFPRFPFMRVLVTLLGVLLLDAFGFTTGAFLERPDYPALLLAAMTSKALIALFFSAALIVYLRFIEPAGVATAAPNHPLRDFFYSFTYREKFELQAEQTEEVEARLEKAQAVAHMGFLDWNLDSNEIYWSDEMLRILGVAPGRNRQTLESTKAFVHPDDIAMAVASLERGVAGIAPHSLDHRMLRTDGTPIWVHAEGELIAGKDGIPPRFLGTLVDITQRKRAEEERRQVFERITDAFVALDTDWVYTYVNSKAAQIFGRRPEDLIGKHIWTEFPEGIDQPFHRYYQQAMAEQQPLLLEEYYAPYDRWFENRIYPSPEGLTIYFHDVTERVRQRQALMQRITHDELTGLPNRGAMRDEIDTVLANGGAAPAQVGVIVLNIDRLHHVNDTLGYDVGDQVLVEAAMRLRRFAAADDCSVGRIGGDEFLLVKPLTGAAGSLEVVARAAAQVLAQPYTIHEQPVYLTCSAGVSWSPEAGRDAAQLLGQADLALNIAKQRGRNQFVLYSEERSADMADRIVVTTAMRQALQHDELQLHYHPVVDAVDGAIVSAEALMRWTNPTLGVIDPNRFIPIAEDTGMIVRLGDWVLRSAIAEIGVWQARGRHVVPLSVNVSAVQFQRPEFVEEIQDALHHAGVAPGLLKLEITESVVMEDKQTAVDMLKQLRALGVRISLDDFGTGYSSLGQLRLLPIDEIKIDKSFVRDINDDRYAATLYRAIIAMSQQLRFTVVAEGVETAAQARFLNEAGCQLLQGFLFSRPVAAPVLGQWLVDDTRWGLDGAVQSGRNGGGAARANGH
jgi:diguanylate cyclase (GGDEF)-like protein/PAS domain S-box-containing protein